MPLDEFWHGDMRLLKAYQNAYLRNVSYRAWYNGQYNFLAFGISMENAFAEKGKKAKGYVEWKDPIENKQKVEITKDNLEYEFRKEQARQQEWLRGLLNKK